MLLSTDSVNPSEIALRSVSKSHPGNSKVEGMWKDPFPEAIFNPYLKGKRRVFHVPAPEEMLPSFLFLNPPLLSPSSSIIPVQV